MNELTKEASKQAILKRFASMWRGGRGRVRKSSQQPYTPLHGHPRDYLTGLEPSGECIDEWSCSVPFKFEHEIDWCVVTRRYDDLPKLDLDKFKRECEEVDNE